MQRRYRPITVDTRYLNHPETRMIDASTLNGGLCLWEQDYKLEINQSPDLLNVYWKDGCISSRPGQAYIYESFGDIDQYGRTYACYHRPWPNSVSGNLIVHKGKKLYSVDINPNSDTYGAHTSIYDGELTEAAGGTFFVFGSKLYYMNGHEYIVIDGVPKATDVVPFIPRVLLGVDPKTGTGGTQFQDENRIAAGKQIVYTQTATPEAVFQIPTGYFPLDADILRIKANGVKYYELVNITEFPAPGDENALYKLGSTYYKWENNVFEEVTLPDLTKTFTVDRTNGKVTFNTAPSQTQILTPNNVEITIFKDNPEARRSIMSCSCATVFGGDTSLAVVCGGSAAQPNAYFWSGNTTAGLDPTYFPFDYYNYAGADANEYVIGFGKQQSMLVIFKERSIGKSYFRTETINNVDYLRLPYTPVNESVGCDIEKSIRLVQNNIVFANTYGGVYVLLDTTAAGENTVTRISRNVNGTGKDKGLLYDLSKTATTEITSFDDGQRYWLAANGHVYLWDYIVSSFKRNESKISWFLFDNISARSWFTGFNRNCYVRADGSIICFTENIFSDFGEGFKRKYVFATLNGGSYESLKDILKIVFAVRSDTNSRMQITYDTDYERRRDKTDIISHNWTLSPRDLSERDLTVTKYATTAVREPRTYHVRHFSMTLENDEIFTDMSLVSAQIFYRFSLGDR